MAGALSQMGMALAMDAKLDGNKTWYFAVKEGLFVKEELKATMGGVISVEAMNMSIGLAGKPNGHDGAGEKIAEDASHRCRGKRPRPHAHGFMT